MKISDYILGWLVSSVILTILLCVLSCLIYLIIAFMIWSLALPASHLIFSLLRLYLAGGMLVSALFICSDEFKDIVTKDEKI